MKKILKNKKTVMALVMAVVVLIIAVTLIFYYNNKNRINISKYLTVNYKGVNGYASAQIQIDSEKIYNRLANKEKDETKLAKYKSFVESLKSSTEMTDISNGDSITIVTDYDKELAEELDLNIVNANYSMRAKGIGDGENISLFENVSVKFTGISPNACVVIENNWDKEFLNSLTFSVDKSKNISKNDEIEIKCDTSDEDFERHGYIADKLNVKVIADKLSVYISDSSQIQTDVLDQSDKICQQTITDQTTDPTFRMLYKATENKDYLHKMNDETVENIQLTNKYFMKRKNKEEEITDNYIYLIYKTTVKCSDAQSDVYFAFEFCNGYLTDDSKFVMDTDQTDKNYTCSDSFEKLYQNLIISKGEQYDIFEIPGN